MTDLPAYVQSYQTKNTDFVINQLGGPISYPNTNSSNTVGHYKVATNKILTQGTVLVERDIEIYE